MNILIIGANGRVGSQLARIFWPSKGILCTLPPAAQARIAARGNIRHQALDLTAPLADISQIVAAIRPDAVYFTAGSRSKNLLQVDAFGAVKAMQAAKANGVQRFILLSSVFALQPERWGEKSLADITDYNIAKYFADHWLVHNSGLDYTLIAARRLAGNHRQRPDSNQRGRAAGQCHRQCGRHIGRLAKRAEQHRQSHHHGRWQHPRLPPHLSHLKELNMSIQAVELIKAYRLLNIGATTLISAQHDGMENVMAAA